MHGRRVCAVNKNALLSSTRCCCRRLPQRRAADIVRSCAERKQVRVSVESVVYVSTRSRSAHNGHEFLEPHGGTCCLGARHPLSLESMGYSMRPWWASFGQANPEVQLGQEVEFARLACKNYDSNAERRKKTEGQLQSAQYLHKELPVRLAYAISSLDEMEDMGLTDIETVARVREKYQKSLVQLQGTQRPHDRDSVKAFTVAVELVQDRGSDTARLMACGLMELMGSCGHGDDDRSQIKHQDCEGEAKLQRVQDFMDKFYQNRVAMRFLCGHFLALSSPPRKGFVGLIQQGVSLSHIAQSAAMEAASICCHALGGCPEIRIRVDRSGDGVVAAVPEYVHYVVLELLKNAMMATMKTHGCGDAQAAMTNRGGWHRGGKNNEHAPNVFADVPEVIISVRAGSDDDVFLIVSDQGGGLPPEDVCKVWSYLYTTADKAVRTSYLANGGNSPSKPPPLAGLGCGLPLSRIYARCFGGELKLQSEEGRGTHATLRLSRHGTKVEPVVWSKSAKGADKPDKHVQFRQEPCVSASDNA